MKKNIIIIILSVLVLGLSGYLVCDKFLNEEKQDENILNEIILTDEEAYDLGNNLYNYGKDVLWCKKYEYLTYTNELGNIDYKFVDNLGYEILNFEEVKNKFTSDNLVKYTPSEDYTSFDSSIIKADNKYYDPSMCGRGADLSYNSTELKISKKEVNKIVFDAVSSYCEVYYDYATGPMDFASCKLMVKKLEEFVIEKENNEWKIDRITIPF